MNNQANEKAFRLGYFFAYQDGAGGGHWTQEAEDAAWARSLPEAQGCPPDDRLLDIIADCIPMTPEGIATRQRISAAIAKYYEVFPPTQEPT